jgi:general secretion pathway protein H
VSSSGYGFDRYARGRWLPFAERPFEGEDWANGVKAKGREGRQRIRFDSLGLPDRSLDLMLATDDHTASVRVLANGEVAVR